MKTYIVQIDDAFSRWQEEAKKLEEEWDAKPLEDIEVDYGYVGDWYISSVTDDPPIWTDDHIKELVYDFHLIPKQEDEQD